MGGNISLRNDESCITLLDWSMYSIADSFSSVTKIANWFRILLPFKYTCFLIRMWRSKLRYVSWVPFEMVNWIDNERITAIEMRQRSPLMMRVISSHESKRKWFKVYNSQKGNKREKKADSYRETWSEDDVDSKEIIKHLRMKILDYHDILQLVRLLNLNRNMDAIQMQTIKNPSAKLFP